MIRRYTWPQGASVADAWFACRYTPTLLKSELERYAVTRASWYEVRQAFERLMPWNGSNTFCLGVNPGNSPDPSLIRDRDCRSLEAAWVTLAVADSSLSAADHLRIAADLLEAGGDLVLVARLVNDASKEIIGALGEAR